MGIDRHEVLVELLQCITAVVPDRPALVAIDGFDGAGKTVLAHELAELATTAGSRRVINVSIDDFHHPRTSRRAAGTGPESFYRTSYDYQAFQRHVVTPLRAGRPIVPAVWDVDADKPIDAASVDPSPDALVVVDGIFLHRPELRQLWDASVWVDVPFSVSVPRGNARFPGDHDPDPESPEHHRYVGGQRLYLAEASPREFATWVFDNTDLDHPKLTAGISTPSL